VEQFPHLKGSYSAVQMVKL